MDHLSEMQENYEERRAAGRGEGMTACVDLYKKWKKEPNFCGLGNKEATLVNSYIEFVEEFSKDTGISEEIIYRNAPRTAVKAILKFKKDSDIRTRVTKEIEKILKSKQAITTRFVSNAIGILPATKPFVKSPIAITLSGASADATRTNEVRDKVRLITSALSSGQLKTLNEVMERYELNNEYEAIALVIKWAKERVYDAKTK